MTGAMWMPTKAPDLSRVFFWPIVAIDPSPRRIGHGVRMLELLAATPFHAFFGMTIMMSARPVVGYFSHASAWGISASSDQNTAGSIA